MANYQSTHTGANIDAAITWALKHLGVDVSALKASVDKLKTYTLTAVATLLGVTLKIKIGDGDEVAVSLPLATTARAGIISGTDKQNLNRAVNNISRTDDLYEDAFTDLSFFYNATAVKMLFDNEDGVSHEFVMNVATQSTAGVMSADDKKHLDAVYDTIDDAVGEIWTRRTTSGYSLWYSNLAEENTEVKLLEATSQYAGVMTAQDKTRLDAVYAYCKAQGWVS